LPFSFDGDVAQALIGASGRATLIVDSGDTAIALGSGDVPVFATPRMIALMEGAACNALVGRLAPELTSVGTDVNIRHRRPSPIGATITAEATVTEVDGALVTFTVVAHDDHALDASKALIGIGTHTRAVVMREAFIAGLHER
jgi:fluoroacetyl-CoA thioesterase